MGGCKECLVEGGSGIIVINEILYEFWLMVYAFMYVFSFFFMVGCFLDWIWCIYMALELEWGSRESKDCIVYFYLEWDVDFGLPFILILSGIYPISLVVIYEHSIIAAIK